VLIANTLINAMATALVTAIAIQFFGHDESVITIATGAVAFLLIVFAEISPKVIGATYPGKNRAADQPWCCKPLMKLAKPVIWFVNLFVTAVRPLFRIKAGAHVHQPACRPKSCAPSCWKAATSSRKSTRASCSTCSTWKPSRSRTS
jgi:Mg2+/Co2+ transporter CorB